MIGIGKQLRSSRISRAALGFALVLGTAGMVATPAAAKEKAPKQTPLKLTPEFQKLASPLQKQLDDAKAKSGQPASAFTAEKAQVEQLFPLAKSPDDKYVAGQFALSLGSISQDPALQRKGIVAMIESGKSPPSELGKLQFYAGQLAFQDKDYVAAQTSLQAALTAGYSPNETNVLLAETYLAQNQAPQGLRLLRQAIDGQKSKGVAVPESWYRRGLIAAYQAKAAPDAMAFANGLVTAYPNQKNWGLAITIVREVSNVPSQDMVDLLRLMGRTNSYAEARDYLEYIEAADPRRLPGEAAKVIEAGIASGKLQASDRTVAEYRSVASQRMAADKASLPALERDARTASATAVTVLASGDAFLSYGDAAKAEALYQIALGKPGVDQERALTRLGIAQVDEGKYAEAQATFAKIAGPRKPIADLWIAYAASKAKPAAPAAPPA